MDMEKKVIRMGGAVVAAAIVLRLLSGGGLGTVVQALNTPQVAQWLIFLQTGRLVRLEAPTPVPELPEVTLPEQTQPAPERPLAVFTSQDAQLVDIHNDCGYQVDTAALLQQPLTWELAASEPTVLILHTHGTEGYAESPGYRSQLETENVIAIGDRIAGHLEAAGIQVLHDRTLHDEPSYNGSYSHARNSIAQYLESYPSIQMVLDVHRDAAEDSNGQQINYTVDTPAGKAAKLMLVVGTDAGGLDHPNWQANLALAVKLHAQLQKLQPEICRPISFRSSRFNQDMSAGAMLIEVGAAGNSRQEAMLAADILAQGLLQLAHGTAP